MSIPATLSQSLSVDDEELPLTDQDYLSGDGIVMGSQDTVPLIDHGSENQFSETESEREPEANSVVEVDHVSQRVQEAAREAERQSQQVRVHLRRGIDREREQQREIDSDLRARFLYLSRAWEHNQNWENWFPDSARLLRSEVLVEEIDDIIIDWLRPKRFEERLEALSETINFLSLRRGEVKDHERDLRTSPGDNLEARM